MKVIIFLLLIVTSFSSVIRTQTASEMQTANTAERAAVKAYQSKNRAEFLMQIETANWNRPNHPRIIYNLAVAHALNGRLDDSLDGLERLNGMGLAYAFEKNEDLKPLFETERFKTLKARSDSNRMPINASTRALTIEDKTLIAESVAFDTKSKSWFAGSVHQRKIIKVGNDGSVQDFSSPSDGLWSVLGIKIDQKRNHLWAATSALPQMKGYTAELKGRSGLAKYDLRTGKLLKLYRLPASENHALGDLVLNNEGRVFATDSAAPTIYSIDPKTDQLSAFTTSDLFVSLQGLTFGSTEKVLYVADYSKGIFRIDVQSREITQMKPADQVTLLGIDGLYFYAGKLIAIQNGVNPNRVVAFVVADGAITSFKPLEANHSDFMEPTLGMVVGDEFYFVANSQWPLVSENAGLNMDKLVSPVILKLNLKKELAKGASVSK
ncbi:MAG: hypothetical protein IPM21_16950 [Acidobacteria bacterium]|nr:hypothetical protein [Acidobacteriota bacterium]